MNSGVQIDDRIVTEVASAESLKTLLFYSDAAEFGGHERMTVEAVRHLSSRGNAKVYFAFYEGNQILKASLNGIREAGGNLALAPLAFKSESLQAFRSLLSPGKIKRVENLVRRINPDVVVVSQGRIEGGGIGLMAAKRAGFPVISYLPLAHPTSVSGKSFGAGIRDAVNTYFYRLPDRFITISEGSRDKLLERGAKCSIVVVANGIEAIQIREFDRRNFREAHHFAECDYVVAVVGRIDFRQKAQDFAVRAIAKFRQSLQGCKFLFVGSGPDEGKLKEMITRAHLEKEARVLPWSTHPELVYAGIDLLLISSKFEGVPLVMLEAMSCRLPVVGSDVDGMAEYLPAGWRFPFGDGLAMTETILRVKRGDNQQLLDTNQRKIAREFAISNFHGEFAEAVLNFA
jgi:glycosyltransferase involved in cell wall biosynthesis